VKQLNPRRALPNVKQCLAMHLKVENLSHKLDRPFIFALVDFKFNAQVYLVRIFTFPREMNDTAARKNGGLKVALLRPFMQKTKRIQNRALSRCVASNEEVKIGQMNRFVTQAPVAPRGQA